MRYSARKENENNMEKDKLEIIVQLLEKYDFSELQKICAYINYMVSSEQKNRTLHQKFSSENIELMKDTINRNRHF